MLRYVSKSSFIFSFFSLEAGCTFSFFLCHDSIIPFYGYFLHINMESAENGKLLMFIVLRV